MEYSFRAGESGMYDSHVPNKLLCGFGLLLYAFGHPSWAYATSSNKTAAGISIIAYLILPRSGRETRSPWRWHELELVRKSPTAQFQYKIMGLDLNIKVHSQSGRQISP